MNSTFGMAAGQLIAMTNTSLYALIDGLQFERYYGSELETSEGTILPLFNIYPDSRIAFAGPWLIDMNKLMSFREKLIDLEKNLPAVSWILSTLSLRELFTHLQQCINIEMPDGQTAFLRLQDPRVQIRLGQQLDELQHRKITKNVDEWYSNAINRIYSLKKREFIC